jgi:hypothetical protein
MSMKTLFSVLLLYMLVATPMAAEYGESDNSGPWQCYPGSSFPEYPLPGCRALVKLQCVGKQAPEAVLRDCCQQLANISDWCRCPAISTMLSSMFKELSVQEGEEAREVFPGCRREVMKLTAGSVPAVCKLRIILDATAQGAYVCPSSY